MFELEKVSLSCDNQTCHIVYKLMKHNIIHKLMKLWGRANESHNFQVFRKTAP